ncbi:MAG: DUF1667 domain-containing protein [Spirochaetes bacterium]|nr:DUF1667 domain-containing protein [Spirochaetota bacterium]MBU1079320.1 DUF1667 domain-containing protein [Spirochaetota bacterium]
MSETKVVTCIECPRGCRLSVSVDGGAATVTGHACPKGEAYGAQEAISPMRTLTTTVVAEGAATRRLPVRTDGELPLGRLLEAMAAIDPVVVRPPLRRGDVIVRDLLGLGVDLVATDDLVPATPSATAPLAASGIAGAAGTTGTAGTAGAEGGRP